MHAQYLEAFLGSGMPRPESDRRVRLQERESL